MKQKQQNQFLTSFTEEGDAVGEKGRKKGSFKKSKLKLNRVTIGLTDKEKEQLEAEASQAGYTLNAYLREKLKEVK